MPEIYQESDITVTANLLSRRGPSNSQRKIFCLSPFFTQQDQPTWTSTFVQACFANFVISSLNEMSDFSTVNCASLNCSKKFFYRYSYSNIQCVVTVRFPRSL
jgi:hypothetical protein